MFNKSSNFYLKTKTPVFNFFYLHRYKIQQSHSKLFACLKKNKVPSAIYNYGHC